MQTKDIIHMAGPDIGPREKEYVSDAMNHWYGKESYAYCDRLQVEFAKYHDRKFALMTPNCTSALHLILAAIGVGPGDEVIVPDCTWIGSTAGIHYLGAKTVFADIQKDNWCIDPLSVKKLISERTKVILCVNLYGNMCDMIALQDLADKHKILLLEDAAESIGSKLNNIPSGKFGVASCFSFHRTKTISCGEGGMLLLDDEVLYDRCRFLRDHGRHESIPYYTVEIAYKYMPSNILAAIALAQFERLEELVTKKRELFSFYKERLSTTKSLSLNPQKENEFNSYWASTLVFDKSCNLSSFDAIKRLEQMGAHTRPFFFPLSSLPAYDEQEKYQKQNINAYDISKRAINLPSAANLSKEQQEFICNSILKILL
jgi:perosamine synthetase